MTHSPVRTHHLTTALVIPSLLILSLSTAQGQEAQPTPNVADLERRVRELEAVIQRLQATQPAGVPAAPGTTPAPGTPPENVMPEQVGEGGTPAQAPSGGGSGASGSGDSSPGSGSSSSGDSTSGSRGRNITDELGLRSRGVFETSVTRRVIGAGRIAGWDDGFFLRTPDGSNWLRVGADYQTDYRGFPNDNDKKDIDSFLVRRARLSFDGILGTYYDFRLMVDFSNGQSATNITASPRILDAYANVHYWDAFQLELGKYKQPIGFEQLILDRYNPFIERGMFDQLLPAREPGIMAHGEFLFNDLLDYAVSLSNGEINADYDTNDHKDVVGRIVVRPFNGWFLIEPLRRLQFGIGATIGIEEESLNGFTVRTPATVPWLSFNNLTTVGSTTISNVVTAAGRRTRVAPEVSYFGGPLGIAAQYYHENQFLKEGPSGPSGAINLDVPTDGYVVLATLLLTGETRTAYTQAIEPLRPFSPCSPFRCFGAWEVVGRLDRLEYGNQIFTPFTVRSGTSTAVVRLADPTQYSRGATDLTVGFNWYLNRFVKVQFNYEHAWFDDPVKLGSGANNLVRSDDAVLARFQFNF